MGNSLVASQPTKDQLVTYANAVTIVNNYAYAIINQQLPNLNNPPTNYTDYVNKLGTARNHALNWSQVIFVKMIALPNTIKDNADLFDLQKTSIESYLNTLISDPGNTTIKAKLDNSLQSLIRNIQAQKTTITNLEGQLTNFTTNIGSDAKSLTQLSNEALNSAGNDASIIHEINNDIETLKIELSKAQKLLVVSEIGMGLSLWVGVVGAAICLIPGAQFIGGVLIMVAVAGEAASIAGTVIESQRIQEIQKQITSYANQVSSTNQSVIALTALSQQFEDLYQANLNATSALTDIKEMWQNLELAVTNLNNDLTAVKTDVTSEQYSQALSDFQEAESNWADLVNFAEALADITYSWQDSQGNWHQFGDQNPDLDNADVYQIPAQTTA